MKERTGNTTTRRRAARHHPPDPPNPPTRPPSDSRRSERRRSSCHACHRHSTNSTRSSMPPSMALVVALRVLVRAPTPVPVPVVGLGRARRYRLERCCLWCIGCARRLCRATRRSVGDALCRFHRVNDLTNDVPNPLPSPTPSPPAPLTHNPTGGPDPAGVAGGEPAARAFFQGRGRAATTQDALPNLHSDGGGVGQPAPMGQK